MLSTAPLPLPVPSSLCHYAGGFNMVGCIPALCLFQSNQPIKVDVPGGAHAHKRVAFISNHIKWK